MLIMFQEGSDSLLKILMIYIESNSNNKLEDVWKNLSR